MKNQENLYASIPYVDKKVSRIFAGTAFSPIQDGADGTDFFEAALANGINAFDTARVYMEAEHSFGNWLEKSGRREEVVILSKCGHPDAMWNKRVNEKEMRKDLKKSLEELKTDYIDIYMLHRDDPDTEVAVAVETFNAMHEEGNIGAFGASNWTHTRIEEANEYAYKHNLIPFSVSSPNFCLARQIEDPWGGGCVNISGPENIEARAWYEKNQMPVAAIVGYTNAGKSTLINTLTNAGVLEEDKLFATLDPTTRVLELSGRQQILVTDTVGFIRKLPHHLIEAFKSTLEEAKYADYILHVVDASNPQHEKQMLIVYETLANLDVKDKTVITLFNKQDARMDSEPLHDFKADHTLPISAKNGTGLEELKNLLSELLRENKILVERTVPYANAGVIQLVRKSGELLEEEYREDGIYIRAYVPMEIYAKL